MNSTRSKTTVVLPSLSLSMPPRISFLLNPSCVFSFKHRIGPGFLNLGNTCFLNSILQCLTHTVPLLQKLCASNHPHPCTGGVEGFCGKYALNKIVWETFALPHGGIFPYAFVDNLSNIYSSFRINQQEDAHEFLHCVLGKLESCSSNSSSEEASIVKTLFGGNLKSKLRCRNCNAVSCSFEEFIDLSLEIKKAKTLYRALKSFTRVEKIGDRGSKFTCGKCREEVIAEKQFRVNRLPSVAIFHLKRFENHINGVEKIKRYVYYPSVLNLQPYTTNPQGCSQSNFMYELYALVVHIGDSVSSGHYVSYVRWSPGKWYKMDDEKVTRVSDLEVLSQEAYILFYAKEGTPRYSSFSREFKRQIKGLDRITPSPTSAFDFGRLGAPSEERDNNIGIAVETRDDKKEFSAPPGRLTNNSVHYTKMAPPPPRSPPNPDVSAKEQPAAVRNHSIPQGPVKVKKTLKRAAPNKVAEESKINEAKNTVPLAPAIISSECCLASTPTTGGSSRRKKQKPVRAPMQ